MNPINFVTCGQVGDLIHSLYVIKSTCLRDNCKANLFIADNSYINSVSACGNFTFDLHKTFNDIYDLISQQEYINNFDIYSGTTATQINLLGEYTPTLDFNVLKLRLSNSLVNYVTNTVNLNVLFGFDKILPTAIQSNSNDLLKPHIKKLILDKIEKISDSKIT